MASAGVNVGLDLVNPINWAKAIVKYARLAVWAPDPVTQIAINVAIIVVAAVSSSVPLLTWMFVIVPFALLFLTIGIIRALYRALIG